MPSGPYNPHEEVPAYLDEKALELPGWPGYRTRPGRSGLDYLDNQFELAHMQGLFIRRLITGQLRTHEPLYLAAMGLLGGLAALPALAGLLFPSAGLLALPAACCSLPMAAAGAALLWNLGRNLRRR